jgi:hypothetical protein
MVANQAGTADRRLLSRIGIEIVAAEAGEGSGQRRLRTGDASHKDQLLGWLTQDLLCDQEKVDQLKTACHDGGRLSSHR